MAQCTSVKLWNRRCTRNSWRRRYTAVFSHFSHIAGFAPAADPWRNINDSIHLFDTESKAIWCLSSASIIRKLCVTLRRSKKEITGLVAQGCHLLSFSPIVCSSLVSALLLQPLIVTRPPFHRDASIKRLLFFLEKALADAEARTRASCRW